MKKTHNNNGLPEETGEKGASLVYRYAASALDGLIIGFVSIPIVVLLFLIGYDEESTMVRLTQTLIGFTYSVYLTSKYLSTWGKDFFKLKVKTLDGGEMSVGRAIKREVVGKMISVLILGLGYIWALFNYRRQGWHDKIAGTMVVETELLSNGKKFIAYFLTFGLFGLGLIAILAVAVLTSINPQKQLDKAKEQQKIYEQRQNEQPANKLDIDENESVIN